MRILYVLKCNSTSKQNYILILINSWLEIILHYWGLGKQSSNIEILEGKTCL